MQAARSGIAWRPVSVASRGNPDLAQAMTKVAIVTDVGVETPRQAGRDTNRRPEIRRRCRPSGTKANGEQHIQQETDDTDLKDDCLKAVPQLWRPLASVRLDRICRDSVEVASRGGNRQIDPTVVIHLLLPRVTGQRLGCPPPEIGGGKS